MEECGRLDNAYRETSPVPDDCFFSFQGDKVLLREEEDTPCRLQQRMLRREQRYLYRAGIAGQVYF